MSKKKRFYIEGDKLFDNTYLLGLVRDFRDLDFVDMLNSLAEQLAEKDKEIEKWKNKVEQYANFFYIDINDIKQVKLLRHHICEEIRHRALLLNDNCPNHKIERMYGVRKCLLDQIEKGE